MYGLGQFQVWRRLVTSNGQFNYHELAATDPPDVILRDIPRTFQANDFFRGEIGRGALGRVATAYSAYDAEVGYCQGHCFIIAALLLQGGIQCCRDNTYVFEVMRPDFTSAT